MKPAIKKSFLLTLLLVFICPIKSYRHLDAQEIQPCKDEPLKSLFQSEEPLHLTLTMDIHSVFGSRESEEPYPAEISYRIDDGKTIALPIKVNVRGNFRKDSTNCDFPPLRFDFSDSNTRNTIFESQDKLKLVTHCRSGSNQYEQNVLKEYLAYKLYNLFTEESYRVRLVQLTYTDLRRKLDTVEKIGFLIEPTSHLLDRNDCEKLEIEKIQQIETNKHKTTVLAVFQYMIGNTDWSVWHQHNIILIQEDTSPVPIIVPYDFDWSGLVNAPYALPSGSLPSVRSRLYQNFCRTDAELQVALDDFRQRREEIYQTCKNVPFLSARELKKTLKYVDDFFRVIENPKKVESEFHRNCRIM